MQSDGSNDDINMDLSANEQAELDLAAKEAAEKGTTDDAAAQAAAKAEADKAAAAEAAKPDPAKEALEAARATIEAANKLAAQAEARENAAAAAAAKQLADAEAAKAAEAEKEPDWAAMKAELARKNEAGEIDDDEFEQQREALLDQRSEWKGAHAARQEHARLRKEDEASAQARHQQTEEQRWQSAWGTFSADESNAVIMQDPTRVRAFNAELQAVGQANPDMTYADMLATTKANVLKAFNIQQTAEDKNKAAIKAEEARRLREAGAGAPNLNNLPNSGADLSGGKYAHLDALDVDSLENALAAMKREDVEAYLASSPGSNTRGTEG